MYYGSCFSLSCVVWLRCFCHLGSSQTSSIGAAAINMLLLGVAAPLSAPPPSMAAPLSAPPPGIPRACVPPHDAYPFCNAKLPKEQRVNDLISRLTLEEKPYLLVARESPKGNISRLGIPEYDLSLIHI